MIIDEWNGCYKARWKGVLTDASMRHPAKFSRGLIERIYRHAYEEGWISAGAKVLDPFGGVATGAHDAMLRGLDWYGIELEPHFVETGFGYDCPGFEKGFWKRYYGRISRLNYRQFHLCPECVNRFEAAQWIIPSQEPHRYHGNIDRWTMRYAGKLPNYGRGILLQGDSRRLLEVLKERGAEAVVSSPPYVESNQNYKQGWKTIDPEKLAQSSHNRYSSNREAHYGDSEGNLASMTPGDFSAVVSSPPYADGCAHTGGDDRDGYLRGGVLHGVGLAGQESVDPYGQSAGQLGAMTPGSFDAVVASPPYADRSAAPIEVQGRDAGALGMNEGETYGATDGQLGAMTPGSIEAVISSPPYSQSLKKPNGIDDSKIKKPGGPNSQSVLDPRYGQSAGQLGEMPTGQFAAAISSPPFLQASGGTNQTHSEGPLANSRLLARHAAGNKSAHAYGEMDGQLSGLKDDGFDAAISSPPFEDSLSRDTVDANARRAYAREHGIDNTANVTIVEMGRIGARDQEYGATPGQIGNDSGETFWSAAAQIVAQAFDALAPGAHAVWVVKGYIKDKKLVDFPEQWRALCESVGFVTLHEHHAMLVEHRGTSLTLDGEEIRHEVSRKSFFRRLVESKGAPRLDFETVYCMVKPERGEAC